MLPICVMISYLENVWSMSIFTFTHKNFPDAHADALFLPLNYLDSSNAVVWNHKACFNFLDFQYFRSKTYFFLWIKQLLFFTSQFLFQSYIFTWMHIWHTPRYSIRSGPICPNFQMTTFKANNVFLVFGMGQTRNKLTNEYKKMQNFKNLVD